MDVFLSIVIPAYNEAERIGPTLDRLRQWANAGPLTCEVIVVADGSADATANMARTRDSAELPVRVLAGPVSRGKGASVRRGMMAAVGRLVLLCDADLSAPIDQLDSLLQAMRDGAEVAIGSRAMAASILDPPQPWPRRLAGRCFRRLRRAMLLPHLRDTQCGFKLFTQAAAKELFRRQTVDNAAFDCEVLAMAVRRGLDVREVPIRWGHVGGGPLRVSVESFRMLASVLALRKRLGPCAPDNAPSPADDDRP
jgi:dolichyl-phosphate beta-glucosyltransferase